MRRDLAAQPLVCEVFLDQVDNNASEQEQRNQVRNCHQTVKGIRDVPEQAEIDGRAEYGDKRINDEERTHDLVGLAQEFDASGAIQSPADDGGEGKAAQRNGGEDGNPAAISRNKAVDGQLRTGSAAVVDRYTAAQNNQSGQSADQDSVGKYLKDAKQTLLDRLVRIGAGMRDGTSTQTGFVGENAAGYALFQAEEQFMPCAT